MKFPDITVGHRRAQCRQNVTSRPPCSWSNGKCSPLTGRPLRTSHHAHHSSRHAHHSSHLCLVYGDLYSGWLGDLEKTEIREANRPILPQHRRRTSLGLVMPWTIELSNRGRSAQNCTDNWQSQRYAPTTDRSDSSSYERQSHDV